MNISILVLLLFKYFGCDIIQTQIVFTIANVLFTIGTLFLLSKVIKNRGCLHDFDFNGSTITSFALMFMVFGYYNSKMYQALFFMLPTLFFWIFITISILKIKLERGMYDLYTA